MIADLVWNKYTVGLVTGGVAVFAGYLWHRAQVIEAENLWRQSAQVETLQQSLKQMERAHEAQALVIARTEQALTTLATVETRKRTVGSTIDRVQQSAPGAGDYAKLSQSALTSYAAQTTGNFYQCLREANELAGEAAAASEVAWAHRDSWPRSYDDTLKMQIHQLTEKDRP